jgi:hypothetical protein
VRTLFFLFIFPTIIVCAGCSHCEKDIPFRTEFIPYEGDIESIPAAPLVVVIRGKDSPYFSFFRDMFKLDLTPLLERGTLLVSTESRSITRIQERVSDSEIWVSTESRRKGTSAIPGIDAGIPGSDPIPGKHLLGIAIIPQTSQPIYLIDKIALTEE